MDVCISITEPANVFDAIVIRNPSRCDCWTPKLGFSSRSLDEHIRFINQHGVQKALLIAESIDFLDQCPSLKALMIIPADSAAPYFDYQPLYQTKCVYLDCRTAYGGSTEPLHTELDYSKMLQLEELRLSGVEHKNYEQLRQLKSVHISKAPKLNLYIRSHLKYAGCNENLFEEAAADAVQDASGSVLRKINRICENCLLYGAQHQKQTIDGPAVQYVIDHEIFA